MKGLIIAAIVTVGLGIIGVLVMCTCYFNWNSNFNGVVKFDVSINRDTAEVDIQRVLDDLQDLEPYAININGVNYGNGKPVTYADNIINTVTYEANVGFRTNKPIEAVREHFSMVYGESRGVSIGRTPIWYILIVLESIGMLIVVFGAIAGIVFVVEY